MARDAVWYKCSGVIPVPWVQSLPRSICAALLFCSKDYRPILPYLRQITDRFATHFQYTITAYGRDVEPRVPSVNTSVDTLLELERIVGARRAQPSLL